MATPRLDAGQVGIVLIMVVAFAGAIWSGDISGRQARQLETLQAGLPVPPSFKLVDERTISKLSHATSTRSYTSPSPYSEIKAFYVAELEQRGWHLSRESIVREWGTYKGGYLLVFKRDAHEITLQFKGRQGPPNGWDYAISVSWEQVLLW